jgi:calcium binding protein 39
MGAFLGKICACFGNEGSETGASGTPGSCTITRSCLWNDCSSFNQLFVDKDNEAINASTAASMNSLTAASHNANTSNSSGLNTLMTFYKQKPKGPREVVRLLRYYLQKYDTAYALGRDPKSLAKASQDASKQIAALKELTIQSEEEVTRGYYDLQMFLVKEVYESDVLGILCHDMEKFDFESRKDAVSIFNSLLRRMIPPSKPIIAEYLRDSRRDLLGVLLQGYDKPEHTLNYGLMLRECAKYDFLAEAILDMEEFDLLFTYIQQPTFDLSSDAFATFKDLLTKHKQLTTAYLPRNYERIFPRLNMLLGSENYVTKRQSLKLLGEILHDRRNYEVMLRYVSEVENLKLLMTQLRDKSEKIQYEAFQVFKIFIANPNKPKPIYDILCKNRDKILHFLESFTGGGREDRSLQEDKVFLIEKLQQLPQYQSSSCLGSQLHPSAVLSEVSTQPRHYQQASHSDSVPMTSAAMPLKNLNDSIKTGDAGHSNLIRSGTPDSLHDSTSFLSAVTGSGRSVRSDTSTALSSSSSSNSSSDEAETR